MFSQIIPRDSIFLLQYLLGTALTSNFGASSVFSRSGPVVEFMIDYGEQVPFDRMMLNDVYDAYEAILRYETNKICTMASVPNSYKVPGPHVAKPFNLMISNFSYEHNNETTTFYNIKSPVTCMFDDKDQFLAMSDSELDSHIDDFINNGPNYQRSFCSNRGRRTPWVLTDSLANPVVENGKIVSASGFRFSVLLTKTSHCIQAEACVAGGNPWSCSRQIRATCYYISAIFDDIKNNNFILKDLSRRVKKVYGSADDMYMFNSFMTSLDLKALGWGILPVLILLFIFMHRAIPFKKEWFLYSRLGLYFWGIFTTATACLAGAASMAWMGRETTVVNAACYLLSLGLSVDDILVLLSQIKHLNLVTDNDDDDDHKLDDNELDGTKTYWKSPVKSKAEEQLGRALTNCGITIFTTSLTTAVSAWFTTFSRLPALGSFGIQTAVSVTFTWVCFSFGWLPILAVHLQRVESRRYDVLFIKSRTSISKTKTPKISFDSFARLLTRFTTAKWPSMIIVGLTLLASIGGWAFCWKIKFRTNFSTLAQPDAAYDIGLRYYNKNYAPHVGIDATVVNIASYPYCDENCVSKFNGVINLLCGAIGKENLGGLCDYKFKAGNIEEQLMLDKQLEVAKSLSPTNPLTNSPYYNSVWEGFKVKSGSLVNGTYQWPVTGGIFSPLYGKYYNYLKSSAFIPYNATSSAYWDVANDQGFHANNDVNPSSLIKNILKCSTTNDTTIKLICTGLGVALPSTLDVPISSSINYRHFYAFNNKVDLATNAVGVRVPDPELVKVVDSILELAKSFISKHADEIALAINDISGSELFNGKTVERIVKALLDGKTEQLLTFSVADFGTQYFSVLDNNMPAELATGIGGVLAAFCICVTIFFDITLAIIAVLTVILEYGFLICGLIIFGVNYDVTWLLFMIISSGIVVDHALHVIGEFSITNREWPRRKRIYKAFSGLCPALLGGWLTTVLSLIGAVGTYLTLVYKGYIALVVIQGVSFFFSFLFIPALLSIIGPTNMNLQGWYYEITAVYHNVKNKRRNKSLSNEPMDDVIIDTIAEDVVEEHQNLEAQVLPESPFSEEKEILARE